jgi:hypothetical protein
MFSRISNESGFFLCGVQPQNTFEFFLGNIAVVLNDNSLYFAGFVINDVIFPFNGNNIFPHDIPPCVQITRYSRRGQASDFAWARAMARRRSARPWPFLRLPEILATSSKISAAGLVMVVTI